MPRLILAAAPAPALLAETWQALEARSDGSFFQGWSWTGCTYAARFPDPVLLRAEESGRVLALGLFNRRPRRLARSCLHLGESGDAARDAVFIEHNGFLIDRAAPAGLAAACLRAALTLALPNGGTRRLVLSGIGDDLFAAARSFAPRVTDTRPAPFVDLAALRARGGPYLDRLSANTRYQLRRSARAYAARGPLAVQRAASLAEALDFLDRLARLHQRTWQARGKPGAFANPAFREFHAALIARGLPRGEVDLLRIAAGGDAIGYLYNFRYRDRIAAYQSGFDYEAAGAHAKPGLTCHHLAIEHYAATGAVAYDFLAGGDRYKASLADAAATLHWIEMSPTATLPGLLDRARSLAHACRARFT